MFDFTFLAPCPASGLMVQGDQDDIVPPDSVKKLVDKLSTQRGIKIDYRIIKGANHFFGKHMDEMSGIVGDYMDKAMAASEAAAKAAEKAG